jgi:hypothetical protein
MTAIEYASVDAIRDGWKSLSRHTGLNIEVIGQMAVAGELRSLFGADGSLLPQAELRSRFGGPRPDPAKAVAALGPKRPAISGREALDGLRRKRQSWTFP